MKNEAERFTDILVSCQITTQRHNPEDLDLHLHRRGNLKFRIRTVKFVT